ncbi:metadherin a isoform X2 [Lampris incognitus]|uniref:metadherin a isoform X2 n=1 Tax=Lampris incognitus TaxID=2546036 RepID=UPI0024B56B83|nr:metadherin a isoform X2 [Lampris incognitus]
MATDLRALAWEKAEVLSGGLKELLSTGQLYIRSRFGVDLGLNPELYPTWMLLSAAAAAVLLLLAASWAAVCGGLSAGKKRGSPVTRDGAEPAKAGFVKTEKSDDQKRKNRKKPAEKKTQSNGRPVSAPQGEVKVCVATSKPSPEIKTEKVQQAPVQVKKNKKKAKEDVKAAQSVSTTEGKEPDEGTWETKVSNREKRQQRKKDKGPMESGSPGAPGTPKSQVEAPAALVATNTRKNRETLHSRTGGKADTKSGPGWREEPSVNGGGWADVSSKVPGQMEGDKWSAMSAAPRRKAKPEPRSWGQETQGTWSGMDGRIKNDLSPVSFTMLGLNASETMVHPIDLQWDSHPKVDDEWSGFNGMAAVDPSSDWNAPVEHWGNYVEPPVSVTPAVPPKEQLAPHKESEDDKEVKDPTGGVAKSKKKKKKKKAEEEADSAAQTVNSAPTVNTTPKPQEHPPVMTTNKQLPNVPASQKKSEQVSEPPKPSQKKKVRKET